MHLSYDTLGDTLGETRADASGDTVADAFGVTEADAWGAVGTPEPGSVFSPGFTSSVTRGSLVPTGFVTFPSQAARPISIIKASAKMTRFIFFLLHSSLLGRSNLLKEAIAPARSLSRKFSFYTVPGQSPSITTLRFQKRLYFALKNDIIKEPPRKHELKRRTFYGIKG
jgi:hypothetical protein